MVAVTKGFGHAYAHAAVEAGLFDLGENYAQELMAKAPALAVAGVRPRWHFLGAIQRNKVPALAPLVSCWQSVARPEEGAAIAKRRPGAQVLVEVDVSGDPGRNGCAPEAVAGLVSSLAAEGLDVVGLMVVAPHGAPARPAFRVVRDLADRLGLAERSMGMTDDLEDAVREGTTMVRVGRALFGERPPRRPRP